MTYEKLIAMLRERANGMREMVKVRFNATSGPLEADALDEAADALKTLVEENKRFSGTLTALASDAHEMKPEAVRTIARQALSHGSSR